MSRISLLSAVNTLVKALPPMIRNIDLRVVGCAAIALGALAYFSTRGCSFFDLPESKPNYGFSDGQLNRTTTYTYTNASNHQMTAQCTFRQVCESVFPCVDNLISELDIQNGSNTSFLRPLTNVIDSPCHGNDVKGDGERLTLYSYAHSQNGIMPYLNCGLEGASYRTASNAVKQKSWVHQILQQFRDKGSIRTFQFDNDGMLTITK